MSVEPFAWDVSALLCLNGDGGSAVDFLMYYASAKLTWVPLYALLVWAVWRKVGWRRTVLFAVVVALLILCADQTATLAKEYLPKFRPSHYEPIMADVHTVYGYRGGSFGTISSHAANSIALMILCATILRRRWIWWGMWAWVCLVSYSRLYLGVHYPLDIALGLVEGALWGALWSYVYWIMSKRIK